MSWRPISSLLGCISLVGVCAAQPAPPQTIDLTNRSIPVSAMLDVHGRSLEYVWFSLSRVCNIRVHSAKGTGFTIRYRIETINGSTVLRTVGGTNPKVRQTTLPPGRYAFIMEARREAGYYTFQLETYCQ